MDAGKFKCPRNMCAAKMLASLWRPQQHMVGSIVDGIGIFHWLIPPDMSKNANLSVTLTADVLQRSMDTCKERGVPLPSCFRVHSDNAGGEVKNQTFMKFLAMQVHKKKFSCAEMSQFRVGHSHGRVDRLFSEVGQVLNKQKVLESPDDFQKCMKQQASKKKKSSRLPTEVIQIGAMYDWQTFFEGLDISPHGHVQTRAMTLEDREPMWNQNTPDQQTTKTTTAISTDTMYHRQLLDRAYWNW